MTDTIDLTRPAQEVARLLNGIADDQLGSPTPCPAYSLADLLDHVDGLSLAFTWAATKDPAIAASEAPTPDGSRLRPGWRERTAGQLEALAEAWRDPAAWQGMTRAGGVDLPGEVAGLVAMNELVVHGWDVARASRQEYELDDESLQVSLTFLAASATPEEAASREGIFGPVVPVPEAAPLMDRVIGLSGRDPSWSAS